MTHITGKDRSQLLLLPDAVDDYVGPDNPVRFMDALVDGLDLDAAGFQRVRPNDKDRPGYDPAIFATDAPKTPTDGSSATRTRRRWTGWRNASLLSNQRLTTWTSHTVCIHFEKIMLSMIFGRWQSQKVFDNRDVEVLQSADNAIVATCSGIY